MFAADRDRLQARGRAAGTALRVHDRLQQRPIMSVPGTVDALAISWTAANHAMGALENLGIVREITGHKRNRLYAYDQYLNLMAEGTEPIE